MGWFFVHSRVRVSVVVTVVVMNNRLGSGLGVGRLVLIAGLRLGFNVVATVAVMTIG